MIDAPSQTFGGFYAALNLAAWIVAVVIRAVVTRPDRAADAVHLDTYQLAYLVGGTRHVVRAALAGLVQREAVGPDALRRRLCRGGASPGRAAVEQVVWRTVSDLAPVRVGRVYRACAEPLASGGRPGSLAGLVPDGPYAWSVRLGPALVAASPAIVGLVRLSHRLPQHRPVGLLALLCTVPVLVGLLLAGRPVYSTRAGAAVVRDARERHEALRHIGFVRIRRTRPAEVSLAVALFGPEPLRGNDLSWLADLLWPAPASTGDGSSDAGGGSDGGHGHGGGGDPF